MKTINGNGRFDYRLTENPLAPVAVVDRETGATVAEIPLHDFRLVVSAWERLWGAALRRARVKQAPEPPEPKRRSLGSRIMQQVIEDRRGE